MSNSLVKIAVYFTVVFLAGCEMGDFDFSKFRKEDAQKFDENQTDNRQAELLAKHGDALEALVINERINGKTPNKLVVNTQYATGLKYLKGDLETRDYVEAARWFKLAAEQGHHDSQYKLGSMYEHGIGVEKNIDFSLEWFTKSAEGQNVYAQNQLGWIYTYGHGVERNYDLAVKWFRSASERNYCVPQANLSTMYRDGKGVSQDNGLARTWWNLALESDSDNKLKNQKFNEFQMLR
jgi:TPR repeat protein